MNVRRDGTHNVIQVGAKCDFEATGAYGFFCGAQYFLVGVEARVVPPNCARNLLELVAEGHDVQAQQLARQILHSKIFF